MLVNHNIYKLFPLSHAVGVFIIQHHIKSHKIHSHVVEDLRKPE